MSLELSCLLLPIPCPLVRHPMSGELKTECLSLIARLTVYTWRRKRKSLVTAGNSWLVSLFPADDFLFPRARCPEHQKSIEKERCSGSFHLAVGFLAICFPVEFSMIGELLSEFFLLVSLFQAVPNQWTIEIQRLQERL